LRDLKASGSREASGLRVSLAPLSGTADRPANPGAPNAAVAGVLSGATISMAQTKKSRHGSEMGVFSF
jgi:hypothetical protein